MDRGWGCDKQRCMMLSFTSLRSLQKVAKELDRPFVRLSQQSFPTNVVLLVPNHHPPAVDDILVRDELEELEKDRPDQLKLHYTIDRPPKDGRSWTYSTGFITKEMLQEHMLFGDGSSPKDTQVFMCGPPPMIKFACLPNLTELGFTEKEWFVF
jgi:cytochrome-b5 reductase